MTKSEKPEETEEERIKLEKEFKEKLKLYLIIMRPIDSPAITVERAVGVLAYRPVDAIAKAQQIWGGEGIGTVYHGDYILMEQLLSLLDEEEIEERKEKTKARKKKTSQKTENQPKMPLETFKASLLMVMNEYVEDEKDRKTLARIIKKISTPQRS